MASHQDFVDYVAEQLRESGSIRSRKMFGEYGLYCDDIFFAVIFDDQLFIKVTPVSYTHLDVYKRQGKALPVQRQAQILQTFPGQLLRPGADDIQRCDLVAMGLYIVGKGIQIVFRAAAGRCV